jgi:murein DD-endopeptidase MepM/ murein hydrolase activator NlpD
MFGRKRRHVRRKSPRKSSSSRGSKSQKQTARIVIYFVLVFVGFWLFKYYDHLQKVTSAPPPKMAKLQVIKGDFKKEPLYFVLKRYGLSELTILKINNRLKNVFDPRDLKREDKYVLKLTEDGEFHRLEITKDNVKYYVAGLLDEKVVSGEREVPVYTRQGQASGVIKGSLWDSMIAQKISPLLIYAFTEAFASYVDFFTETWNGDKFALVWEDDYTKEGGVIRQRLLAARYIGKGVGAHSAYKYKNGFYEKDGETLERMFLRAPLVYKRISSHFTERRFHPVLKIYRPHHGIDYAAAVGTPVSAIATGHVKLVGWNGGLGKNVQITHSQGYISSYGHLSRFAHIKVGQRIEKGDVVGYVGQTGLASGPHLDFRLQHNGKWINFERIKNRSTGKKLSDQERKEFKELIKPLIKKLNDLT